MTESYRLTDGIFNAQTLEELKSRIEEFLARKKVQATVSLHEDSVVADFLTEENIGADEDENIVIGFCQSGRFGKARRVVRELIEKRPWDANARRLLAQILMMEGVVDEALICCHESLCLSPRNEYALVFMGNLLARDRGRLAEALKYYKKALEVNPDSALTLTNYAALRLESGEIGIDEAERLLKRSLELDSHQLTTYHALAQVYNMKQCPKEAFRTAQDGLKNGFARAENREPIRESLLEMVVKLASALAVEGVSTEVTERMKAYGDKYGTPIRLEARDDLDVPLRMELAQNHQRDEHVIVYSPTKAGSSLNHLLCLTLEKAEMHQAAKQAGCEKRMVNTVGQYRQFLASTRPFMSKEFRSLIAGREDSMLKFLHHGLIEQLSNSVPDALAERRLFERMPDLRPAQLMGIIELAKGIVQSAHVGVANDMPKNVVRATRTMGLFTLFAYRDIVGIDMRGDVAAPKDEYKMATELFEEFKRLEQDYTPGAEWGLVESMAKKLGLDTYCQIIPDDDAADLASVAQKAQAKLAAREEAMVDTSNDSFLSNLKANPAIGMSVMFFMMEAIRQMRTMDPTEVRKIAFEIATLGISGITPGKKNGYRIAALPGKDMSGCQALAWYYASWRMAFPEKIGLLEQSMPFADQYQKAMALLDAKDAK